MGFRLKESLAGILAGAMVFAQASPAYALNAHRALPRANASAGKIIYSTKLADKRTVDVYANGFASITDDRTKTMHVAPLPWNDFQALTGADPAQARALLPQTLEMAKSAPYVPGRIVVVFRAGTTMPDDSVSVNAKTLKALRNVKTQTAPPQYTNDPRTNALFAKLGVDRAERIGRQFTRSRLSSMVSMSSARTSAPLLDISNAFRLHLINSSVISAVKQVAQLPGVAYVAPDWRVSSMNVGFRPLPKRLLAQPAAMNLTRSALGRVTHAASSSTLSADYLQNYASASNLQPMLDAPGVDAIAAFDEIESKYGELPGTGEIITNVSLGDLDDDSVRQNPADPCFYFVGNYGPTTRMIGAQRYLDMPSMPLIPTYTADSAGNLNSGGEVCGVDPSLGEVGLDFSVMAPLPHDRQRPEDLGTGLTDLLGIAPGAQYRLVVPASAQPSNSDLLGAFLGAAAQSPAPNVINASIGFASDGYGFPGRYLEDDLLSQSVIRTLTGSMNIVVCISANDGLRMATNAPVNPSGGSTATNVTADSTAQTNLSDLYFSTAPAYDMDSGAIDVGGTTLDDISAVNPADPASGALGSVRTFAETRWTGFTSFSSGFGSRVNISAPSDNIVSFSHNTLPGGHSYNSVNIGLNGGTSASAPEVAAAAAVALQVARLSGHPLTSPAAVRDLLVQTATPVADVPQADRKLNVGPQLDVRRAVEQLLMNSGASTQPAIARVAVMMRRSGDLTEFGGSQNTAFLENTDPGFIDLRGPVDILSRNNTDINAHSLITIAPEWEGLPANVQYRLSIAGHPDKVLATTPYARLYPAQILNAAGMPLASNAAQRTVSLTYAALSGLHGLVQTTFDVNFGPADASTQYVSAPIVPAVASGTTIPVTYDFSAFPQGLAANPTLIVSFPGRTNPFTGPRYFAAYTQQLSATSGTVNVPISALQGGGIYGIGIWMNAGNPRANQIYSDFSYVRVSAGDARPAAPLLSTTDITSIPGHYLEIPYGSSFRVQYDVSKIPNATGALLEVSAPGPTLWNNANAFNNPNGSVPDANGQDSGSVATIPLYGTSGTVTIKSSDANLAPAMQHTLRIIPLNGTQAAGEAGDVSTILMDGIAAADGGGLQGGFAVNAAGDDAFYTSSQQTADGYVLNSVGTFSQTTGTPASLAIQEWTDTFSMPGAGMLGADTGFFQDATPGQPTSYLSIPHVATAHPWDIQSWFPPALANPNSQIVQMGENATSTIGAFLVDNGSDQSPASRFSAFASDVAGSDSPTPVNISGPLASMWSPVARAFDYNPLTNTAYLAADEEWSYCPSTPTTMIAVNFGSGAVSSFQNAVGKTLDFTLDPNTNVGMVTSACTQGGTQPQVGLVNLGSSTTTPVTFGRYVPTLVANDPVNKLFLVQEPLPEDVDTNNNPLSAITVLDENGTRLKSIEQFNFAWTELGNHFFQVNGKKRRGFAFGPSFSPFAPLYLEISPFNY